EPLVLGQATTAMPWISISMVGSAKPVTVIADFRHRRRLARIPMATVEANVRRRHCWREEDRRSSRRRPCAPAWPHSATRPFRQDEKLSPNGATARYSANEARQRRFAGATTGSGDSRPRRPEETKSTAAARTYLPPILGHT